MHIRISEALAWRRAHSHLSACQLMGALQIEECSSVAMVYKAIVRISDVVIHHGRKEEGSIYRACCVLQTTVGRHC